MRNIRTTSCRMRGRDGRAGKHRENDRKVCNRARNAAGDSTRAAASTVTVASEERMTTRKRARDKARHTAGLGSVRIGSARTHLNTLEQDVHTHEFCTHSAGTQGHQERRTRPTRLHVCPNANSLQRRRLLGCYTRPPPLSCRPSFLALGGPRPYILFLLAGVRPALHPGSLARLSLCLAFRSHPSF